MALGLSLPFVGQMDVDADLVARRTPYGPVAEWRGDERRGTATVDGQLLRRAVEHPEPGLYYDDDSRTLKFGGLRLRVLGMMCGDGWAADAFYVKLDGPRAALVSLYREKVGAFLLFVVRCEAAVRAFKGQPVEGVEMPFAKRLAAKLL